MNNILKEEKMKQAALFLSRSTEKQRNMFLNTLSEVLIKNTAAIVQANKKDLTLAQTHKLPIAFIERLILDVKGIKQLVLKLHDIQKLKSGIGETIERRINQQQLLLKKVRIPLGIIMVIYEARPEVTIDVAALCIKSGNAAILKGGSEALYTNQVLYDCIITALQTAAFPKEAIYCIVDLNRKRIHNLLKRDDLIDLVIARGGYRLVKSVQSNSKIPVLSHSAGGARIYIDKSADLSITEKIIINAKTSKPAACNSIDTIVVHQDISREFIPFISRALQKARVKISHVQNDWGAEFLGLILNIKIVRNIQDAVDFINRYSKRHSEGIISTDKKAIEYFVNSVDSAAVFANCSTRLHDGYVFGLGSEMGIATGKLHARGPVGLKELTTYRWEVYGNGQIRE